MVRLEAYLLGIEGLRTIHIGDGIATNSSFQSITVFLSCASPRSFLPLRERPASGAFFWAYSFFLRRCEELLQHWSDGRRDDVVGLTFQRLVLRTGENARDRL
jgi:hypothetical protein